MWYPPAPGLWLLGSTTVRLEPPADDSNAYWTVPVHRFPPCAPHPSLGR